MNELPSYANLLETRLNLYREVRDAAAQLLDMLSELPPQVGDVADFGRVQDAVMSVRLALEDVDQAERDVAEAEPANGGTAQ